MENGKKYNEKRCLQQLPMWEILRSPKSLYWWVGKEVVDTGQARFGIGFSHLWKAGVGA